MARWSCRETVGRELNTGHLEDASDRTTGESIKSAVCNTDITRQTVCIHVLRELKDVVEVDEGIQVVRPDCLLRKKRAYDTDRYNDS